MKTARNPATIHPPLASYAHQIEVAGPERLLFVSGQVGMRPDGAISSDPIDQLQVALDNVRLNLEAAGMEIADLVKLTFYFVGEVDTVHRRSVVASWLGAHQPCMTTLYVAALASPVYKVEVDGWASRAG
jgi:enamine deaminase RidA (YjgF/YER057c/UK114 family)